MVLPKIVQASKLNWPLLQRLRAQHSTLGLLYINKDNGPGIVRLLIRWLRVKENMSIRQEALLCNKKSSLGDAVAREP